MGMMDIGAVVVLGLFGLWGGFRGLVRTLIALLLLAGALYVAGQFSGKLEETVGKVVTLEDRARCVLAWGATFVLLYVVASILVGVIAKFARRVPRLPGFSLVGAILGLLQGAIVLLIAVYAVVGHWTAADRPQFVVDVEKSATADLAAKASHEVRRWLPLPACVAAEVDAADARIGG